jgi:tight adherence protein C
MRDLVLDLATLEVFVLAMGLAWWLVARALPRPRPTAGARPLPDLFTGMATEAADAPGRAWLEGLAAQLPPFAGVEFDKDLRRAGYYRPGARQRLLALRNGLLISAVLLTGFLAVAIGPQHQRALRWTLGIGVLAAVLGLTLPRVVLALNARRRVARIRAALPDALDTISMCLGGGISLQECLGYVGREMMSTHPDLALELLVVGQQADMNSFEFAVEQFAGRIDAPEIVALTSLIAQNQRLGTAVVDSIRDFADNLRLKRRQMAEAKASRAELFMLFPVIFFLVPSVLLILWGPAILSLIDFIQSPTSPLRAGR